MQITLAEALLRRKELQQKVDQLSQLKGAKWFETKVQRVQVTESIDNVAAEVAKVPIESMTASYDWHAKQLRLVDAVIQRTNWETQVEIAETVMSDFVTPKEIMG